jgi:hypothetical protein
MAKSKVIQLRLAMDPALVKRLKARAEHKDVPLNKEITTLILAGLAADQAAELVERVETGMDAIKRMYAETSLALAEAARKREGK